MSQILIACVQTVHTMLGVATSAGEMLMMVPQIKLSGCDPDFTDHVFIRSE